MAPTKVEWERVFQLLQTRRFQQARALLQSEAAGRASFAERLGVEGLISLISKEEGTSSDTRLRATVRARLTSAWSDTFDKVYFGVFRRYLQFLSEGSGAESGQVKNVGIVENPAEEKEHDVAP